MLENGAVDRNDLVEGHLRPANLVRLLSTLASEKEADPEIVRHLTSVIEILSHQDDEARPFLSVLLRTQGRRIEPLKDALLCLSAQTNEDFDVIVIEHDATDDDSASVAEVIARLNPKFADRVSLVKVKGGSRAKPLNQGVLAARGRYIAVYDDDDLIFANWVEAFAQVAGAEQGRMLRSVVANQSVIPEVWPQGQEGFRTASWPKAEYPSKFNQLDHLVVNYSPFMSWAFPRSLFASLGLRFDEELAVCEDWDLILRGSLLCGVDDVPELTAIYRRWQGGDSSYSRHSVNAWRESEQRVIDRLDSSVLMLPPGSIETLRTMLLSEDALRRFGFLFKGNQLREPLHLILKISSPGLRFAVRVRNKIRRMRAQRR